MINPNFRITAAQRNRDYSRTRRGEVKVAKDARKAHHKATREARQRKAARRSK